MSNDSEGNGFVMSRSCGDGTRSPSSPQASEPSAAWVLVPREPSEAMCEAGMLKSMDGPLIAMCEAEEVYRAMVSAAPAQQPPSLSRPLFAIINQLEAAKSSLIFNEQWTNAAGYITDAALWIERAISAADDALSVSLASPIGGQSRELAEQRQSLPSLSDAVEDGGNG